MNKKRSFVMAVATTMILSLYSNTAIMAETGLSGSGDSSGGSINNNPEYYPASFPHKGVVREIKPATHEIIIDGRQYSYRIDLKVHSPVQKYGSIYSLEVGQTLGFSYIENRKGNGTITEIWVINDGDYQNS